MEFKLSCPLPFDTNLLRLSKQQVVAAVVVVAVVVVVFFYTCWYAFSHNINWNSCHNLVENA